MQAPAQWFIDKWIEGFVNDLVVAFPIIFVMSFGVYVLLGMVSKTLAKIGVGCVFLYGGLIVLL